MLFSAMVICFVVRHVTIFFTLLFKQLAGAKQELIPRGSEQFLCEFQLCTFSVEILWCYHLRLVKGIAVNH